MILISIFLDMSETLTTKRLGTINYPNDLIPPKK
jgi:hypothetical protein